MSRYIVMVEEHFLLFTVFRFSRKSMQITPFESQKTASITISADMTAFASFGTDSQG